MMDEDDINDLIQGCRTLKYKFHGVFAANNFSAHFIVQNNIYIKESSLLPTITTSINSWRINQFKVQTLNFLDFFVFILLILFSMLKNL